MNWTSGRHGSIFSGLTWQTQLALIIGIILKVGIAVPVITFISFLLALPVRVLLMKRRVLG